MTGLETRRRGHEGARCSPKATRPGARGDRAREMGTEGAKGQHRDAACKSYGRAWQLLRRLNSYCVAQQFHNQVEEKQGHTFTQIPVETAQQND